MLKQYVDSILFPVMYVGLNSRSMQRLERLSRNPAIAKGVRGVEVNLSVYRPSYAHDIKGFNGVMTLFLETVKGTCDAEREMWSDYNEGSPHHGPHAINCPVEVACEDVRQELKSFIAQRSTSQAATHSQSAGGVEGRYAALLWSLYRLLHAAPRKIG